MLYGNMITAAHPQNAYEEIWTDSTTFSKHLRFALVRLG